MPEKVATIKITARLRAAVWVPLRQSSAEFRPPSSHCGCGDWMTAGSSSPQEPTLGMGWIGTRFRRVQASCVGRTKWPSRSACSIARPEAAGFRTGGGRVSEHFHLPPKFAPLGFSRWRLVKSRVAPARLICSGLRQFPSQSRLSSRPHPSIGNRQRSPYLQGLKNAPKGWWKGIWPGFQAYLRP